MIKFAYQILLFPEYVFGGVIFYNEHKYLHKLEFFHFCLLSNISSTIICLAVIFHSGDVLYLKPKLSHLILIRTNVFSSSPVDDNN